MDTYGAHASVFIEVSPDVPEADIEAAFGALMGLADLDLVLAYTGGGGGAKRVRILAVTVGARVARQAAATTAAPAAEVGREPAATTAAPFGGKKKKKGGKKGKAVHAKVRRACVARFSSGPTHRPVNACVHVPEPLAASEVLLRLPCVRAVPTRLLQRL